MLYFNNNSANNKKTPITSEVFIISCAGLQKI